MIAAGPSAGGDGEAPPPPDTPLPVAGRGDFTAPIDDLHLWSNQALAVIRADFADAQRRARQWTPAPCPQLEAAVAALVERERQP